MEHCIRQTAIALRLADRVGVDEDDRVATYYVGLLDSVYCHADAHEQAKWFGDDIGMKADTCAADMESLRYVRLVMRRLGAGDTGLARARRVASFPTRGWKEVDSFLRTHSTLQAEFAERIGLPPSVADALRQSYERWDGKGAPNGIEGERVPLPARIVVLADLVEVYNRTGGVEAAREVARERSGGQLDPTLVDLFCDQAAELLVGLDGDTSWDDVIRPSRDSRAW